MMAAHLARRSGALAAAALLCTGCVSFHGPSDVRRQIARQEHLQLDEQMGVTVGPVGVLLASMIAGTALPVDIRGIDWVSYGEYAAQSMSAEPLNLRDLELDGWERVVRVCEASEDVIVMIPDTDGPIRKLLVVMREGSQVHIVRAEGDLETILDRILESGVVDTTSLAFLGDGSHDDGVCIEEVTIDLPNGALATAGPAQP